MKKRMLLLSAVFSVGCTAHASSESGYGSGSGEQPEDMLPQYEALSDSGSSDSSMHRLREENRIALRSNTPERLKQLHGLLLVNAECGSLKSVKSLIGQGAKIDQITFERAVEGGNVEVFDFLVSCRGGVHVGLGGNLLSKSVKMGSVDLVKYLIEKKIANIGYIDENGETPLLKAVKRHATDIVKYLIEMGADVNYRNEAKYTSLMRASKCGHVRIARVLVDSDADINAQDKEGFTPLIWAVIENRIEVVDFLIEKKADVNAESKEGTTPLSFATRKKHEEIREILIENGAIEKKGLKKSKTQKKSASKSKSKEKYKTKKKR